MEFLDKVKNVATDIAGKSANKSKELYEITKLKIKIADKQGNVKELYKEIGFTAYKAYKAEADILEAISEKLAKIDAIEDEIASLRKDIDDVKNVKIAGVDDISESDEEASEATLVDAEQLEYDEADKEPIDPVQ